MTPVTVKTNPRMSTNNCATRLTERHSASLRALLESAGFALYASEMVCAKCQGQAELAFINVSWARELARLGPAR